jgi:Xaa-Pro aminopeptidase
MVLPALELRRLETKGRSWISNVYAYSSDGEGDYFEDGLPKGLDYESWPVSDTQELNELEGKWKRIIDDFRDNFTENSIQALIRGIKSSGLEKKKVATDDLRIQRWLKDQSSIEIECEFRPDLFNEIRLVKTANEIEILKKAALINEESLLSSIDFMYDGAGWDEIENHYMSEMAKRGGRGVYLLCGVGDLPNEVCRKNEPIMFDALGQYKRYHGDFGRCAVIEKPNSIQIERHQAILEGWKIAQQYLTPGTTYKEISTKVGDYIRGLGFKNFRNPVVHSLGLEHTDDPKLIGAQPGTKPDQVLEANMVINVDMPFTEIGWGSVHMEDTVLITDNGFERLSKSDFGLRIST